MRPEEVANYSFSYLGMGPLSQATFPCLPGPVMAYEKRAPARGRDPFFGVLRRSELDLQGQVRVERLNRRIFLVRVLQHRLERRARVVDVRSVGERRAVA